MSSPNLAVLTVVVAKKCGLSASYNSVKTDCWSFFLEDGIGYVVPDDSRINRDILIPNEHRQGARMGQVVVVELKPRTATFSQPVGMISEILGENMAKGWRWKLLSVIMIFPMFSRRGPQTSF